MTDLVPLQPGAAPERPAYDPATLAVLAAMEEAADVNRRADDPP